MNALKSLIVRINTALDSFWIGIVLRQYHLIQAKRYSRKAAALATFKVQQKDRETVGLQACRHSLEAELIARKWEAA